MPAPDHDVDARPRRRLVLVTAAVAATLAVGGGVATAAAHKSVELDVDGERRSVSTFAGSVQGLLDAEGLTVGEHDLLVPAPGEPLRDGEEVVVRSATEIEVQVDGRTQDIWTTAETTGEALATLAEPGRDVSVAASRSADGGTRSALELPLVVDGVAEVVVAGETRPVQMDGAADLDEVLEEADVTLGKLDSVVVTAKADGTPQIAVTDVEHALRAATEPVPFETVEQEDPELYVGERRVVQEGTEGVLTRLQHALLVNGAETPSATTGELVTSAPVNEIVAVGTKPRPVAPAPVASAPSAPEASDEPASSGSDSGGGSSAPAPAAAPAPAPAPAPAASSGAVSGDVWARLAQCESGGNPTIVSANGLYHGLYQFSVATWQAVGGSGLPSQASPAEQTQRAQALQARSGWGQWPACSAKLGLR
ncbi:resuscitation-promoting factor [Georgenia faecalis]|uniref:resuscitation-promoting factor n=1 Tax=Georgenia faecalis TaxID=2483799 RepID=UPI000FD8E27E|nr:resuscitation-promoting factor [Georgenia faecalis]